MIEWILDEEKCNKVQFEGKRFATSVCGMTYAELHLGDLIAEKGGVVTDQVAADTDYLIYNEAGRKEQNYQTAQELGIRCVHFDRLMFDMGEYSEGDSAQMVAFACITGESLDKEDFRSRYAAIRKLIDFTVFKYCLRAAPAATGRFLALDPAFLKDKGFASFLAADKPVICYHWLLNQKAFGKKFGQAAEEYIGKNRKKVAACIIEADDGEAMREFLKLRGEIKPAEKKEYLQLAESLKKANITALLSNDASQKAPTPTKKTESPNIAGLKYNWSFKKKEDGTILITAYKGKDTEVTIPERIGKDIVTEIGENAFSPGAKRIQNADIRTGITSIVVPDTVTALGDQAFNGCRSLRTIKLPESLVKMGMSVFSGCGKLETLRLPDGLTGKLVLEFMYCRSLKQVYIPDGITSIGMSSFEMCEALEELHVGAGMQSIGYHVLGDAERVAIYAPAGSYAEQFAKENGIHFVAE